MIQVTEGQVRRGLVTSEPQADWEAGSSRAQPIQPPRLYGASQAAMDGLDAGNDGKLLAVQLPGGRATKGIEK